MTTTTIEGLRKGVTKLSTTKRPESPGQGTRQERTDDHALTCSASFRKPFYPELGHKGRSWSGR